MSNMTTATRIPGKDFPLEKTLERAEQSLRILGIEITETSHLNPVPHCWSVHLQATSCPPLYTNGKGTSKLASIASGMGEFIERLATDFFFSQYCLAENSAKTTSEDFIFYPDELCFTPSPSAGGVKNYVHRPTGTQLLTPQLFELYDPEGELDPEHLLDNNSDQPDRGIYALPFTHTGDCNPCYFPISLLNNLYVSNGMAAGNSPSECTSQALSEILERYVKNKVITEGLSLPLIPDDSLKRFPHLLKIRNHIEEHGFSVTIRDSSLGGRYPVICVILIDKDSGGVYAAFGANYRFEVAIERTLTELLQGRRLDQLHNFSHPVHNIELVADPYNLESHFIDSNGLLLWSMFCDEPDFPLSPWSFSGSTKDEELQLKNLIVRAGFTIYKREYLHCGLYTCRIIIPGMSEIYPVEDLIWNNSNKGARLRRQILLLPKMKSQQLEEVLELLEELEVDDQELVSHLIGVLFDKGSNWDTLRIGELKAHIYLLLKDYENAGQWCNWVARFGEVSNPRKRVFLALTTLLELQCEEINIDDYHNGLRRFYTEPEIETAMRVISGSQSFFGLQFADSWSELSTEHKKLLTLYNRLKRAKAGQHPAK